uniref:Uncharacterized protein n=1 Tax=Anopheles atroparvus TaxID=41427 RepID=A0A182J3B8_ANOAO
MYCVAKTYPDDDFISTSGHEGRRFHTEKDGLSGGLGLIGELRPRNEPWRGGGPPGLKPGLCPMLLMPPAPPPLPPMLYGEVTEDEEDEWPPEGPDEPSADSWRDRENLRGFSPSPATPLVTYCCSELKKLILVPG